MFSDKDKKNLEDTKKIFENPFENSLKSLEKFLDSRLVIMREHSFY